MRNIEIKFADGSTEKFECDEVTMSPAGALVLVSQILGNKVMSAAFSPHEWRSVRQIQPEAQLLA